MATTPTTDISAINAYAGKYYQNIIRDITNQLDIANDLYLLRNLTAPRQLWGFSASKGLRPIDTSVEDTNRSAGSFRKRTITPRTMMKVIKVIPEDLRDTFFSEQLSENAKQYPAGFAQYFWEEQAKAIAEEWNDNAYYGVDPETVPTYSALSTYTDKSIIAFETDEGTQYYQNTSGSTTTAGDSPATAPNKWTEVNAKCLAKGLGTLIAEEITASNITPVSTGAISNQNALEKIDGTFWGSIPTKVRRNGNITIFVSDTVFQYRIQNLRSEKTNGGFYTEADIKQAAYEIRDSFGKATIKPASWLGTSGRIIWTIDKNLVMGVNQLPSANPFGHFVQGLQHIKGIFKAISAYQIADLRYMGVNDQV